MATRKKQEGRKLPTVIKKRRGTLRKDRTNPDEPDFDNVTKIPTAPPILKTKEGKQLWTRCAMQLSNIGILFDSCFELLEKYCVAYERMMECEALVTEHGLVYENDKGNLVKNPALTIYNEAFTQWYNLAREMGFSPVSKSKLIANAADKSPAKSNKTKKVSLR